MNWSCPSCQNPSLSKNQRSSLAICVSFSWNKISVRLRKISLAPHHHLYILSFFWWWWGVQQANNSTEQFRFLILQFTGLIHAAEVHYQVKSLPLHLTALCKTNCKRQYMLSTGRPQTGPVALSQLRPCVGTSKNGSKGDCWQDHNQVLASQQPSWSIKGPMSAENKPFINWNQLLSWKS